MTKDSLFLQARKPSHEGQLFTADINKLKEGDLLVLNRTSANGKHRTEPVRFAGVKRKGGIPMFEIKGGAIYSLEQMGCKAYKSRKWNNRQWVTRA